MFEKVGKDLGGNLYIEKFGIREPLRISMGTSAELELLLARPGDSFKANSTPFGIEIDFSKREFNI